ncbi:hypothetical protein RMN57_01880 [Kitasatospora sp. CM 4170]|uniref:Integral membrane protein n=1 Tax=Kitasatospora aburaviensis TaxID=67265 RepID=A0ABW1F068_9ACTN|nr:hypothetical protein [Kitasatospora sp. CM 4170]WNM43533.1 hypothetical protein RMN57_01880 [Kitasatospora sp. CM 4170]
MPTTRPIFPLGDTERPVPVWALRLARALPFVVLPHCLWRLPFAADFRMGMVDPAAPVAPWWTPFYVVGLSVLTELLALLTTGLVSGWGEVVPRRVPLLGGRRVAPLAAVVPAALGSLALVAMFDLYPLAWAGILPETGFSNGWWMALARVCITPAMLWGPIVLVLAWAYYRRRRPA